MAMLPVQAPSEQEPVRKIRPRLTGSSHRGLASRSDERLVGIATDGDERAFEILYERHAPAILRYCRSLLRSTQEAEDVKQEVFVLAISALRRGAEPDAFRPWLYRIAHNACMSHLRMRRPVLVADNGVLVGPAAAAEPVQHHREERRQLLDDIGKLPDVQRGALLLREMDGFSYEQVGEVLGLPLSTVRASIFRARRTLQGLAEARAAPWGAGRGPPTPTASPSSRSSPSSPTAAVAAAGTSRATSPSARAAATSATACAGAGPSWAASPRPARSRPARCSRSRASCSAAWRRAGAAPPSRPPAAAPASPRSPPSPHRASHCSPGWASRRTARSSTRAGPSRR